MGFVCLCQLLTLIIFSALTNTIDKSYQFMIYWFSGSTFILTFLFFLSVCLKVKNKISVDIFPIFFICIHTIGILYLNYLQYKSTDHYYGIENEVELEFCDQIGAFNLLMAIITLLFLRVNWFIIWIATIVMFITTTLTITISGKTKIIGKINDAIILVTNIFVFLASYCFEYLQLKYWLLKKNFEIERIGHM